MNHFFVYLVTPNARSTAEEVENAKAKDDSELIKLAQELLERLDPEGSAAGKYSINVAGDIKGIVGDISGGNINQTIS
ncbi:hypothetical protein [Merismopedia glauca]|uniref:hypothetical protein n=1 Tax=Merismopedia glauca TaxID=292586 RepID=UPI0011B1FE6A|nr:hypothetical protein [Merismopedia glauca]